MSKFITSGYAQDVVVKDTLAFVTQGEGGLMIINISDQGTPKELSTVCKELKGYSNKVAVKDSVVYISAGAFGVSVVDVFNPVNPVVTATNLALKPAEGFDISGNFLFTAIGEYGFKISDISYPTQPDIRGETSTPGFPQGVCVSPDTNYLLVACGEMGFSLFNISELQNGWGTYPIAGWMDTPGYAEDVVSHPTLPYAFLACGTGGLDAAARAAYLARVRREACGTYRSRGRRAGRSRTSSTIPSGFGPCAARIRPRPARPRSSDRVGGPARV